MKQLSIVTILLLVLPINKLLAQPYSIDKYGNGTTTSALVMPPQVYPLQFQIAPDPTGGITNSPVLIYFLGDSVISGDVALVNTNGTVADLLRFFTPSGGKGSAVIYYSQTNSLIHAPADVGIPAWTTAFGISKQSPITIWTPNASEPGSPTTGAPILSLFRYSIITASKPLLSLSGTNLIWTITDGPTNMQFCVLATTNLSTPQTNWICVSTNAYDSSGNCVLTLPVEPDKQGSFYSIRYPASNTH